MQKQYIELPLLCKYILVDVPTATSLNIKGLVLINTFNSLANDLHLNSFVFTVYGKESEAFCACVCVCVCVCVYVPVHVFVWSIRHKALSSPIDHQRQLLVGGLQK